MPGTSKTQGVQYSGFSSDAPLSLYAFREARINYLPAVLSNRERQTFKPLDGNLMWGQGGIPFQPAAKCKRLDYLRLL